MSRSQILSQGRFKPFGHNGAIRVNPPRRGDSVRGLAIGHNAGLAARQIGAARSLLTSLNLTGGWPVVVSAGALTVTPRDFKPAGITCVCLPTNPGWPAGPRALALGFVAVTRWVGFELEARWRA